VKRLITVPECSGGGKKGGEDPGPGDGGREGESGFCSPTFALGEKEKAASRREGHNNSFREGWARWRILMRKEKAEYRPYTVASGI